MGVDRFQCFQELAKHLHEDDITVNLVIGATNFEWWHLRPIPSSLTLGDLGNTVAIALGLALALPHRRVVAISSDGDLCMELGQLSAVGEMTPANLTIVAIDNECYESLGPGPSGHRPTHTARNLDLAGVAKACGIPHAVTVRSLDDFRREITDALERKGPNAIVVKTAVGKAKAPARSIDGKEDKYRFVRYIEQTENIRIIAQERQQQALIEKP